MAAGEGAVMPALSIRFIRTSLIYLLLGFSVGASILFQKGTGLLPSSWRLLPVHIEMLFFGWTLQLILGTAFWILPRFAKKPIRGNETLVGFAYWALNLGIILAVMSPFLPPGFSWGLLIGRVAQGVGVLAFVANAWPRVKGFR